MWVFTCMHVYTLHVCLYIACIPGTHRGQQRTWKTLELELQIAVSYNVGARNQTGPFGRAALLLPTESCPWSRHPAFDVCAGRTGI